MTDAGWTSERGSGVTKSQLESLPLHGVFVWCNDRLEYPRALAQSIGRLDIHIVSPGWLEDDRWRGMKMTGLHIDHAANLTDNQWEGYGQAIMMVQP